MRHILSDNMSRGGGLRLTPSERSQGERSATDPAEQHKGDTRGARRWLKAAVATVASAAMLMGVAGVGIAVAEPNDGTTITKVTPPAGTDAGTSGATGSDAADQGANTAGSAGNANSSNTSDSLQKSDVPAAPETPESNGQQSDTANVQQPAPQSDAPAPAAYHALPGIVQDVPSTKDSIHVQLNDFSVDRKNSINTNHALKFGAVGESASTSQRADLNGWTGNDSPGACQRAIFGGVKNCGTGGVYQGIVQSDLKDGYPVLTGNGGESLAYLFNDDNAAGKNAKYSNVDGLFQKDADGYYSYDSRKNFATLDTTTDPQNPKFKLYESGRFYNLDDDQQLPGSAGAFMPFNDLDRSLWDNTDTYDGVAGYKLAGGDNPDYSFGMNVNTQFYYPENGKVNGKNMVFDFSGDDDVWVFVDGKLVLDMGGIHNDYSGSINFANGDVTISRVYNNGTPQNDASQTNLKNVLGDDWNKAYQTHTLQFFYLERGDGSSNCKLRFNLPTIPSNTIELEKQISGDVNPDTQFQFVASVNYSGKGNDFTPYNGPATIVNADGSTYSTDVLNGEISLKAGQKAQLKPADDADQRFTDNTTYRITEQNASAYTVTANGTVLAPDKDGNVTTGDLNVGTTPHVTVVNSALGAPTHSKTIKQCTDGSCEYELNLDVTGKSSSSSTQNASDVVVVLDTSGSMNEYPTYRLRYAKAAVNTFADGLLTTGSDNRMAVVRFSGLKNDGLRNDASEVTGWTDKAQTVKNSMNGISASGGTNWEAGLRKAGDLLKSKRAGAKAYVVFISDGVPGYYYDQWGQTVGTDRGFNQSAYGAAVSQAQQLRNQGVSTVFSVSVGGVTTMQQFAKDVNGSANGTYFNAADASQLKDLLNQILDKITTSTGYTGIVITDKLSGYMDFAFDTKNPGTNVRVTTSDGSTAPKLTYEFDGKTITATFDPNFELKAGVTYTLHVHVKPTQQAFDDAEWGTSGVSQEYDSNAYTDAQHTGATLTYQVNTSTTGTGASTGKSVTVPYTNRPTFTVPASKLTIEKEWKGADPSTDSITVKVLQGGKVYTKVGKDGTVTLTKDEDGKWATTVYVPAGPKGHTYSIEEETPQGWNSSVNYEVTTDKENHSSVSTDNGNQTGVKLAGLCGQSATATVTNTMISVSSLPLTGGRGTALAVILGGAGVLVLAGTAWTIARKRQQA